MRSMVRVRKKVKLQLVREPVVPVDPKRRQKQLKPGKLLKKKKRQNKFKKRTVLIQVKPRIKPGVFLCNQRNEVFSLSNHCLQSAHDKFLNQWTIRQTGHCSNSGMR